jgi:hypothetical protein
VLAWLLLIQGLAVRDDVERARSAIEHGRDQFLAGDATGAAESFEHGRDLFEEAGSRSRSSILSVAAWIPLAGRNVDVLTAIADAGEATSEAAMVLSDAVAALPGGLQGLAPTGGAVPLERIPPLAEAGQTGADLMTEALTRIEEAPDSLLLGPLTDARRTAEEELRGLSREVHAASSLLRGLPGFLGADHPRRYFFGAQNPAELRGTGGLIGAYSILTIDRGRFRFTPFAPITTLEVRPADELPPKGDYATNYQEFRGDGRFWTAINVMPDFPSVAGVILDAYEASTGESLDGVILADPFALASILRSSGPIELSRYGVEVDEANVVRFTTNEAYGLFDDPAARKRILGDVARAAFERFISQPSADLAALKSILEAGADRHIQAYSVDPIMQSGLLATPVGGRLEPPGSLGDLFAIVVNSAAGSKVDFYQGRDVRGTITLHDDGSATATVDLTLQNDAPSTGQPRYVIGPFDPQVEDRPGAEVLRTLEAGESVALVNIYCGSDCVPRDASLDGAPVPVRSRVDLGMRYFQHYYAIPSEDRRAFQVSWTDPEAWDGNGSGGIYRLSFANQVTVRPTYVSIRIDSPGDMRVVSVNHPMRIVAGSAVYEGTPGSRLDLEVEFAPPLPVRLWRNVTRFLTTPVF